MTMGYTRAVIDRAATEAAGEAGPIRFVAATEGVKDDNIDLRMSGAQLDRYKANPIVLYGHRYYSRDDLPIGRATDVKVDGSRLLMDVMFDTEDEFASQVERKYRGGFLNAVSIGFDVWAWEDGKGSYWMGGVAEKWELLELSAVPLPMDSAAVVESGRSAGAVRAALSLIDAVHSGPLCTVTTDSLRDMFTVEVTRELVAGADTELLGLAIAREMTRAAAVPFDPPTPVPPAPAGISSDAAQGLLAALTIGAFQ